MAFLRQAFAHDGLAVLGEHDFVFVSDFLTAAATVTFLDAAPSASSSTVPSSGSTVSGSCARLGILEARRLLHLLEEFRVAHLM